MPDRDVAFLEDQLSRRTLKELLEPLDEVAPELAPLVTELSQRGTRLVTHGAVGVQRVTEEIGQRRDARQRRQSLRQARRVGGDPAAVAGEAPRGVEQGKQRDELATLGDRAGKTGTLEEIADIGDGFPRGCAGDGQRLAALACFHQGRSDVAQIGLRLEAEGPFAPHRGVSAPGQEVPDPAPLSAPACRD